MQQLRQGIVSKNGTWLYGAGRAVHRWKIAVPTAAVGVGERDGLLSV